MSPARPPWPVFSTVTLSGDSLPAGLAARFPELVVPTQDGICCPTPRTCLDVTLAPDGRELLLFGHIRGEPVCLDPTTGHVVDILQVHRPAAIGPFLINSSLDQYLRMTKAATDLFPFHDGNGDTEDWQDVADHVRKQLEPIDPPAWAWQGFWDEFYWGVAIGDYAPSAFEPPTSKLVR